MLLPFGVVMIPSAKATAMVKRWLGNKQIAIAIAKENLEIHTRNNDKVAIEFWKQVLLALENES